MLSLNHCRKFIKTENDLSDEEIEEIRDSLYGLANIAVSEILQETNRTSGYKRESVKFKQFVESLASEDQSFVRQQVKEYQLLEQISVDEAERKAISSYIELKRN